jgi:YhcH/YjgK/YiaL family protein
MIIDKIKHAKLYAHLSDRLAVALNYLQATDLSEFKSGIYQIEDNEVYASVNEYETKSIEEAKWEAHKKYADIHCVISGEEKIGYANLEAMEVTEQYNPDKDVMFLKGAGDYVTIKPGDFAIFFPHDGHQPGVVCTTKTKVKKVVLKVIV